MSKYDTLNPMQREAVLHTEGPLLILAGAGSGKTRVLTHRIAYLIEEKGVMPWNILAITFTNKAAAEMRERVDRIVGDGAQSVWVSTFHSSCVRILRRFIDHLGYDTNFTIYDTDDQRTLMKQVFKRLNIDSKLFKERAVLSQISSAKNEMVTPEEFAKNAAGFREEKIAQIYAAYQTELRRNNALDFDDLLVKTVELFQTSPEVLSYYQEKFLYIMVDEYQDTNRVQFMMVDLLAGRRRNVCVVGDDDQSIYKFRGADIENILSFEKAFPGARVIKLEQNYRSTQSILNTANAVIRNNRGRKDKTLWTDNEEGSRVRFLQFDTAYEEADAVIREIQSLRESGQGEYSDFAVLYRTNAQSRLLEEKCILYSVPYRLVGGVNFYQRKEIKDILCYLKTVANGRDDLAVQRIINVPRRGIGATTIGKITIFASANGMSFYDALLRVRGIPGLGRAAEKIEKFTALIEALRARAAAGASIRELTEAALEETGYRDELEAEEEIEAQTRLQNVEELINKAASYDGVAETPTLDGFLEEVALVADVDNVDGSENRVVLMTLHSAKGLEFPFVYLSGMEDGLFPSSMAILSDDRDAVEEERRLCYVGITRAQKRLTLTAARQRMTNGETRFSRISRFVEEIPEEYLEEEEAAPGPGSRGRNLSWNRSPGRMGGWGQGGFAAADGGPAGNAGAGRDDGILAGGAGRMPERRNAYAAGGAFGAGAKTSAAFGKAFSIQKADHLDYGEGDRVRHIKFGEGTVKQIADGGKDYEVTVEFDRVGVKKMFASFAKLKRC